MSHVCWCSTVLARAKTVRDLDQKQGLEPSRSISDQLEIPFTLGGIFPDLHGVSVTRKNNEDTVCPEKNKCKQSRLLLIRVVAF